MTEYDISIEDEDGNTYTYDLPAEVPVKKTVFEDVFALKPFYLPPECDGNVKITATVEDPFDMEEVRRFGQRTVEFSSSTTDITIAGSGVYTFTVDKSCATATNIKYIPALYDHGDVTVEFTIGEIGSGEVEAEFDITWDLKMSIASSPWYPYDMGNSSYLMSKIVNSDSKDAEYTGASGGTAFNHIFTIQSCIGVPPLEIKTGYDRNYGYDVKRCCLSDPTFTFTAKNNASDSVTLANVTFKFRFFYDADGPLNNIPAEKQADKYFSKLYTAPSCATDGTSTTNNYLWALVGGYNTQTLGPDYPSEIVKIYAQYPSYNADNKEYYRSVVEMATFYGDDIDYVVYKSATYIDVDSYMSLVNTPGRGEQPIIITSKMLAHDPKEEYRTIDVSVKDNGLITATDAVIIVTTLPSESCEYSFSTNDLLTNISKLRYYDYATDFATVVNVPASIINPIFKERMYHTYQDAVVLQATGNDPLYYVEFAVNGYPTYIPIYNGQTVDFSETLLYSTDGVRSGEIFNFSASVPNTINIKSPESNKYKVSLKCDYGIYEGMCVLDGNDKPWKKVSS